MIIVIRPILVNGIKLKGYGDGKIFIGPDESLKERRKRMLRRPIAEVV